MEGGRTVNMLSSLFIKAHARIQTVRTACGTRRHHEFNCKPAWVNLDPDFNKDFRRIGLWNMGADNRHNFFGNPIAMLDLPLCDDEFLW